MDPLCIIEVTYVILLNCLIVNLFSSKFANLHTVGAVIEHTNVAMLRSWH